MRALLAAALMLSTAACSTDWPEPGKAGMAEFAKPAPAPGAVATALERHLDCSLQRRDTIVQAAADSGHDTGRAAALDQLAARAQREVLGGLPDDGARTLQRFDQEAAVLGLVLHVPPSSPRQCSA